MQTQELYDKLKRKAMMGQMQHAAEDAVSSGLHSVPPTSTAFDDREEHTNHCHIYREPGTTYLRPSHHQPDVHDGGNAYVSQSITHSRRGAWDNTGPITSKYVHYV